MSCLSLLTVPWGDGHLGALVPGRPNDALRRLRGDDPIWNKPEVYCRWVIPISNHYRLQPRLKFLWFPA